MDEKKYEVAKKRVEEIKAFYTHLIVYVVVISALTIINLVTQIGDPYKTYWFLYPLGFWGFGLFWHAMGTFVFTKKGPRSWENRKIKEIMDQMEDE
jgi:hypothetical protein